MRIKLRPLENICPLWNDSPCTLRNAVQSTTIDTSPRFHRNSIYFRDQVNKPKKVFTQFEKPELLAINFRRQIDQATSRPHNYTRSQHNQEKNSKHTIAEPNKFYRVPEKIQRKYDRNGMRSHYVSREKSQFHKTQRSKQTQSHTPSQTSTNFCVSQRLDLSRPLNFFPGPGSYFQENSQELVHPKQKLSTDRRHLLQSQPLK